VKTHVVDLDEIWVGKARGRADFPLESPDTGIPSGEFLDHDFQGDPAIQGFLNGFVDLAHAPLAQFPEELVVGHELIVSGQMERGPIGASRVVPCEARTRGAFMVESPELERIISALSTFQAGQVDEIGTLVPSLTGFRDLSFRDQAEKLQTVLEGALASLGEQALTSSLQVSVFAGLAEGLAPQDRSPQDSPFDAAFRFRVAEWLVRRGAVIEALRIVRAVVPGSQQEKVDLINSLSEIGTRGLEIASPASLDVAVQSFSEAAKLARDLPQANGGIQVNVAGTLVNRAVALEQLRSPKALEAAVVSYEESQDLLKSFPDSDLSVVQIRCLGHLGKSRCLLNLGRFEESADAADEGLDLLKSGVGVGDGRFAGFRETLFELAVRSYSRSQPQFLAEIVLETLANGSPSPGTDILKMHESAFDGILTLLSGSVGPTDASILQEIHQAAGVLIKVQERDLPLSARSVRIRAEFLQFTGRTDAAETMLLGFLKEQPDDILGRLMLARHMQIHQRSREAISTYQGVASDILRQIPDAADDPGFSPTLTRLIGIVAMVIDLKIGEWPKSMDPLSRDSLRDACKEVLEWLILLQDSLSEDLHAPWVRHLQDTEAEVRDGLKEWLAFHRAMSEGVTGNDDDEDEDELGGEEDSNSSAPSDFNAWYEEKRTLRQERMLFGMQALFTRQN